MLGRELVSINPTARQLSFSDGSQSSYDALISSIPLPDLVCMVRGIPGEVLEASHRLACSTCVLVNLGVDREDLSNAHMSYFYDEDICFARLSFPHMLSANNVPPGAGKHSSGGVFFRKEQAINWGP